MYCSIVWKVQRAETLILPVATMCPRPLTFLKEPTKQSYDWRLMNEEAKPKFKGSILLLVGVALMDYTQ